MAGALEKIFNFRRFDKLLTTSGQPSEEQLGLLRGDGVETIINLGLHSHERALPDEAASCDALEIQYIHIPVAFDAPTDEDFERFSAAMDRNMGKRVHVHCIVNARVTAFMYRRAANSASPQEEKARKIMDSVWRPGGVWARFIGSGERVAAESEYFGRDYGL